MWHRDGRVKLVDWEMAGIGSGAQDLGQYVISNMDPAERRCWPLPRARTPPLTVRVLAAWQAVRGARAARVPRGGSGAWSRSVLLNQL